MGKREPVASIVSKPNILAKICEDKGGCFVCLVTHILHMVTVLAMHEQHNWLLKLCIVGKLARDSAKTKNVAILGNQGGSFTLKTILKTDLL